DSQALVVEHDPIASARDRGDNWVPIVVDLHELGVGQSSEDSLEGRERIGSRVMFAEIREHALEVGNHPVEILHPPRVELAVLRRQRSAADRKVGHGEQGQTELLIAVHATSEWQGGAVYPAAWRLTPRGPALNCATKLRLSA